MIMILSFLFLPQAFVGTEIVIMGWGGYSIYGGITVLPFTWHNTLIETYILSNYLVFMISIIAVCTKMTDKQRFIMKIAVSILVVLLLVQLLAAYFPRLLRDVTAIFISVFPLPPMNLMLDGYILGLIMLWTSKPHAKTIVEEKVDIFRQVKLDPKLKRDYDELLKIYEVKYPHNPEGVLRYHLSREFKLVNDLSLALSILKKKFVKATNRNTSH